MPEGLKAPIIERGDNAMTLKGYVASKLIEQNSKESSDTRMTAGPIGAVAGFLIGLFLWSMYDEFATRLKEDN